MIVYNITEKIKYGALECLGIINGAILGGSLFAASMYLTYNDPTTIGSNIGYGMMAGGIIATSMRMTRY
jgi:hypothetical protein